MTCTASTDDPAIATVAVTNGSGQTISGAIVAATGFSVTGVKAGTAELTIACLDVQGGDVGTATIKVRG